MATSTVAAIADPQPPPPSTATDVLEVRVYTPPNTVQGRPNPSSRKCLLPFIDPSVSGGSISIKRSEAQPTSNTNNFLPSELLLALKRQDNTRPSTPPRGRGTKFSSPSSSPRESSVGFRTPGPPAPMWHFPGRRERLRHLTDAPPCVCGAGRDISFLYDSPLKDAKEKGPKKV